MTTTPNLDTIEAEARPHWEAMLEGGTRQAKLIVFHADGTLEHLPVTADWHPRQDEQVTRELAAAAGSDAFAFMFVRDNDAWEGPGGAMLIVAGDDKRRFSAKGPHQAAA